MMFGVTGIPIREQLGLNSVEFGLLTATPVLTGALFRLPLGIWTDRLGGRRLLLALLIVAVIALMILPLRPFMLDTLIALNLSLSPQKIINDNGFVYVADTATGIFVFDNYGSFKRKIPLLNWQTISVHKNSVASINKDLITVYNTSTLMQSQKKIPFFNPLARSFVSGDKFITFSPQQVQVYRFR